MRKSALAILGALVAAAVLLWISAADQEVANIASTSGDQPRDLSNQVVADVVQGAADPTEGTVRFTEAIHGTSEYLAAKQAAEDIHVASGIKPIRLRIVDYDFSQFSQFRNLAQSSNGEFAEPQTVALLDDLPCTFTRYRTESSSGGSLIISANCNEFHDSGSIQVAINTAEQKSNVRLIFGERRARLVPVSPSLAAVYEYIEPTPEEKQRARQEQAQKRGGN